MGNLKTTFENKSVFGLKEETRIPRGKPPSMKRPYSTNSPTHRPKGIEPKLLEVLGHNTNQYMLPYICDPGLKLFLGFTVFYI